jgi:hypothetical protein
MADLPEGAEASPREQRGQAEARPPWRGGPTTMEEEKRRLCIPGAGQ